MFVNSTVTLWTVIFKKISKIGADTRCHILRLKMHRIRRFAFRWGSAADPAGEAYIALPDPRRLLLEF